MLGGGGQWKARSKEQGARSFRIREGAPSKDAGCFLAVRGSRHRTFVAYRLAATLADDVYELVDSWTSFERWSVEMQLVRSADSIGANIAEGLGRGTLADQRRFFLIARGSLRETEHWLERAAVRGLLAEIKYEPRTSELGRVLTGLIRADPNR